MENIKIFILNFINSDDHEIKLCLEKNHKKEIRRSIHNFGFENGIFTKSIINNNEQYILLKKSPFSLDEILDDKALQFFDKFSGVPIPVTTHYEHYIDVTNKYFNSKKWFGLFCDAINKHKNFGQFEQYLYDIKNKIITQIKNHDKFGEYLKFSNKKIMTKSKHYYDSSNNNKKFISIDIKSANFTLLRYYFPEVVDNCISWFDYIKKYTDCEFIINSKHFREIIFGSLGATQKVGQLGPSLLNSVLELIKQNFSLQDSDIYSLSGDELILYGLDIDQEKLRDLVNQNFPEIFRVEFFTLKQLGNKNFYVKEHDNGKIEFKCCPLKFIMHCIKFYEKKECDTLDLKFINENIVATYDHSIFKN